jgi:hypothetical protein
MRASALKRADTKLFLSVALKSGFSLQSENKSSAAHHHKINLEGFRSVLISIIKTILFIFPFVKELLLGKSPPGSVEPASSNLLKKAVIAVGCAAFVVNLFFIHRLYVLANENRVLTKRLALVSGNSDPASITIPFDRPDPPTTPPPVVRSALALSEPAQCPQPVRVSPGKGPPQPLHDFGPELEYLQRIDTIN